MTIINVLKTDKGIVSGSYSFVATDDSQLYTNARAAENKFVELVRKQDSNLTDNDIQAHLESGTYFDFSGVSIDIFLSEPIVTQ
jgi:hypothetical protein